MNEPEPADLHGGMSFLVSAPLALNMPNPGWGLSVLLRDVDDLLFVLDKQGRILKCKARSGIRSTTLTTLRDLNVQDILPAAIKWKYEHAIEQFHQSNFFTPFESMVTLSSTEVNWYEFRLIPTLDGQIVLFIWNVNGYREIARTAPNIPISTEKMIDGWSRSLYLRDFETEGHTRRVTEMTMQLAHLLGLPETDMVHIRRGAQTHDIGKIAIPDDILLKTGKLTKKEWGLMRRHTLMAVDMLKSIPNAEPMLLIPRSHHEKWDGSGYPDGLAGEDIPLPARIFAFADVYDALTSDRPYRQAWSRADALRYIRSQTGAHFDPSLTPEFIRMMIT